MKYLICLFCLAFGALSLSAQVNQTDAKGKKQGKWEKLYPNTRVYEYKGEFKDDKPIGTFTYFYLSTKVKAIINHNEKTGRSEAFMYHENTVLMAYGIFMNQQKDSVWTQFGPTGRLSSRETYKKGVLNGKSIVYYIPEDPDDKAERVAKVSNYKDGKLEGEVIEYFDFGTIKTKCNYVNGQKNGLCISNHANGQPMMHERFKNGLRYGYFFAFDESGKEIGRKYYHYGNLLEGAELEKWLEECKRKGISPNG